MPRKRRSDHPIFSDDSDARRALEALRWPTGPVCPTCNSSKVAAIGGEKKTSRRDGLYRCAECKRQFTVTADTLFHGSKVPLSKWMKIILAEANTTDTSWQMAQDTDLDYKTIEKMRARIYAAVGTYRGPNTVFGKRISKHVREQRPASYQKPPKIPKPPARDPSNLSETMRGFKRWYAWRARNPLNKKIEAPGVLAELDPASKKNLVRTERLLVHLLSEKPVPVRTRRSKSKKLPAKHLAWLVAPNRTISSTEGNCEP
jgi:transposase-like protein